MLFVFHISIDVGGSSVLGLVQGRRVKTVMKMDFEIAISVVL